MLVAYCHHFQLEHEHYHWHHMAAVGPSPEMMEAARRAQDEQARYEGSGFFKTLPAITSTACPPALRVCCLDPNVCCFGGLLIGISVILLILHFASRAF